MKRIGLVGMFKTFRENIIFNESIPGHLAPICKIDAPTSSDSSVASNCPTCTLNPTSKGQAFAEAIRVHDE